MSIETLEKMMKKVFFAPLVIGAICFVQSGFAQAPAPEGAALNGAAGAAGASGGRGGRGGGNAVHGSNETDGTDIDRFIGYPTNSPIHISHGTLLTHEILRNGDPYSPGPNGAVLEYRKALATATLMPLSRTPLSTLPDAYFFYVRSGEGRLDDGKQSWNLKKNMAILAPPNVPHRFINTSDKPLDMIMLTFTGGPDAKHELVVRDVNLLPWCEENAHWSNESRCVFGTADGLIQGERIYLVMDPPFSTNQPHSHGHGTEEIWVRVSSGTGLVLLGSELRELPEGAAYLVPPTGITDHSNINTSKTDTDWWIYIARGPANAGGGRGGGNLNAAGGPGGGAAGAVAVAGGGAGGNGGRGGGRGGSGGFGGGGRGANPNISRDTTEANVPGTPLK